MKTKANYELNNDEDNINDLVDLIWTDMALGRGDTAKEVCCEVNPYACDAALKIAARYIAEQDPRKDTPVESILRNVLEDAVARYVGRLPEWVGEDE
jgi:hypothetical protein